MTFPLFDRFSFVAMSDLLSSTVAQVVGATLIGGVVVAVAFSVLARFRDGGDDVTVDAAQTLANVEQMRARGEISDAEYRNIQASTRRQIGDGSASPESASAET